jgi:hypothetical protein
MAQMLLELAAGPGVGVRDAERPSKDSDVVPSLRRDVGATDEAYGVGLSGRGIGGPPHVPFGLGLGEAGAIDALHDGSAIRFIIEDLRPDDVAAQVTPCLAVPGDIDPARPQQVGEDQALEIHAAEVFEMDRLDHCCRHRTHPSGKTGEARTPRR